MEFSFQLYGARNFPPVIGILPKLKELGYTQVEGYGGLYADVPDLADALKASGMTMPSGHFGLDDLRDTSTTMKLAEKLGVKLVLCPAVPGSERVKPDSGWKELADELAGLAEIYNKAGFEFGWHNHDFEFAPTETGKMPIELLLDGAPNIVWQSDIAWVVKGGQDPLKWIDRYADRIAAVHLKDIAAEGECLDEDGWADVGHGTMDWPALMQAILTKTKCKYFVVEHDNPKDAARSAARSIEAARKLGS